MKTSPTSRTLFTFGLGLLFCVQVLGVSNPRQGPQHTGAADAAGAARVSGEVVSIALPERAAQATQPGAHRPERTQPD